MVIALAGKYLKGKRFEMDRVEGDKMYFKETDMPLSLSRVEVGDEELELMKKMGWLGGWIVSKKFMGRYIFKSEKFAKAKLGFR